MSDLTREEQDNVRTALQVLRVRFGGWDALGGALRMRGDHVSEIARVIMPVSPWMALRVARVVKVSLEDLLAGKFAPVGTCPHCGHVG